MRPIAIYLPQFHPIPENDEWWGKGFTEWTNVAKAKPQFKGHYQPHLPADLGFYDLRLPEVREAQATMAKEHGIYGFCYYHYWFNGRRILERPFQEVLESGKPDFPFMLCWANENWSRRWDGSDEKMLLKQTYSAEDAANHIKELIPAFKDKRYITINGRPVFAIYKPQIIEGLENYIRIFRSESRKAGIDLYICAFEMNEDLHRKNFIQFFDSTIEFQPQSNLLEKFVDKKIDKKYNSNYLLRLFFSLQKRTDKGKWLENVIHKIRLRLDYNEYVILY